MSYHIENNPLFCWANKRTVFQIIETYVIKELSYALKTAKKALNYALKTVKTWYKKCSIVKSKCFILKNIF